MRRSWWPHWSIWITWAPRRVLAAWSPNRLPGAAQAVVVGTYAVSSRQVFVSLKLVRPEGNLTIAAHDYALVLDEELRSLLGLR